MVSARLALLVSTRNAHSARLGLTVGTSRGPFAWSGALDPYICTVGKLRNCPIGADIIAQTYQLRLHPVLASKHGILRVWRILAAFSQRMTATSLKLRRGRQALASIWKDRFAVTSKRPAKISNRFGHAQKDQRREWKASSV